MGAAHLSNELCVVLYCRLYPLRLNTDIPLCDGGGAVLQKPLNKGNIVAVGLVNLRGVPLAETVCTDTLKAQIVANDVKLLLYSPLSDRENQLVPANTIPQAIKKQPKLGCKIAYGGGQRPLVRSRTAAVRSE